MPSPTTADGHGGAGTSDKRQGGLNLRTAVTLLPTPLASDKRNSRSFREDGTLYSQSRPGATLTDAVLSLLPTPAARDWKSGASNLMDENSRPLNEVVVNLLPTPKASDGTHGGPNQRDASGRYYLPGQAVRVDAQWLGSNGKDYGPAVRRWEEITGHPAPCPTEAGAKSNRRLNPAFSEWMMGIEPGHVTDIVDSRNDALHVIGNGVVPRQAEAAFRFLMDDSNWSGEVDETVKPDKPRGKCTGCAFEYQLGTARSGEHKGELVVRKHNSRTGPGLCEGAAKPPREPETEDVPGDVIAVAPGGIPVFASPAPVPAMDTEGPGQEPTTEPDPFQLPGAASVIPDGSVSMQPEPDRDRWMRYLIHGKPHTRATTFAKAASSTFTLNEWQQRMTIAGMVLRPDLVALAHGLDVKQDRKQLNSIAEQAKEAAGQKVAANLGTAYHAFSERLDAGLITLADVPPQYRSRLEQYANAVRAHGLVTRPEWIERTVAVRADQVSAALPVAGTLDRIFQLPNGELVIGDLKTGADLSYGWGEIAVQLALYAHGVNTHGLFDWRTKQWDTTLGLGTPDIKVRTDFAIVMHLPAGGDGCTLHKVDLVKGWQRAQVCGQVMAMQADKGALSHPFTPADVPALPSPEASAADDAWEHAKGVFRGAASQADLAQLYQYAMESGKFHTDQLATLVGIGKDRLNELEAARV